MTNANQGTGNGRSDTERDMTAQHLRAKRRRLRAVIWGYLGMFAATSTSLTVSCKPAFIVLAATMVISQALVLFYNYEARAAFNVGEERRRENVYAQALKIAPSLQSVLAASLTSKDTDLGAASLRDEYFSSDALVGIDRLIDHVGESAFFTATLAAEDAKLWGRLAAILFAISVFVIWLLPALLPAGEAVTDSETWKVWPSLFVALALGPHVETYIGFRQLSAAARDCFSKLSELKKTSGRSQERLARVLFCMGSYDCALAQSWPLSDRAWNKHQSALNASWAQYQKRTA